MEESVYKITLDLHSMSAPVSLNVRQGETGRKICVALMEDGKPYMITSGCYAVFAGKKPDGKVLWNACTIEDNTIVYEVTEQTVNVVGWIPVQIRLYGAGGKLITSPDFVLLVDAPVVRDSEVVAVSENEITALTQLISEVTEILENYPQGGTVTDEQIAAAVDEYLTENPVDGVTDQQIYDAVAAYLIENPVECVTDEQIAAAVEEYLKENPPSGGVSFETDATLKLKDGILRVNTADVVEEDNTLPVTSAAVQTVVGNIGAILDTI